MSRPKRGYAGQSIVEYSLIIAFICFGAIAGLSYLRNSTQNAFGNHADKLGVPTFTPAAYVPPLPTLTPTATAFVVVGGGTATAGANGAAVNSTATTGATATTQAAAGVTPTTGSAIVVNNPTATATTSSMLLTASVNEATNQKTTYALKMENTGTAPVTGVSARVYVNLSELTAAGLSASDVVVDPYWNDCGNASAGSPVLYDAARSIYSIQITWTQTFIAPGQYYTPNSFCNFSFGVRLAGWQTAWNSANDPSYSGTPSYSLGTATYITGYINGARFAGNEP
jgi:Flp pilus assembly pilin Flp